MDQQVEKIIAEAAKLGRLIAETSISKAFLATRQKVQDDKQALEMIEIYQQQLHKIAELEHTGQPIEPEDKRKLVQLQQKTASHESLKSWMKAQADFTELMRKVNQAVTEPFQESSATED